MVLDKKFEEMCESGEVFGPISEAVINAAEAELQVQFPQQYRDFLRKYGAGLFDGVELYGLPVPEENDPPLWQDVVMATKQIRDLRQAGSENPKYIPIVEDGADTYFFLDTTYAPNTKIVAVGPGFEKIVSFNLFEFLVNFSEGQLEL